MSVTIHGVRGPVSATTVARARRTAERFGVDEVVGAAEGITISLDR